MARVFTVPRWLMRAYRIATACEGAYGVIPAIANFPVTPNAWPPRAALTPIAVSILSTHSRFGGVATIDLDTEPFRCFRLRFRQPAMIAGPHRREPPHRDQ